MRPLRAALLVLAPSLVAGAAAQPIADAPRFELPVACAIGRDCFVQNYVDTDPGPGWRDHRCGRLSYDAHSGTDFRVADPARLAGGVAVVAAAPGTVLRTRDDMADAGNADPAAIQGREAGNAVVVDHGGGWETQYSHLRRGSLAVRPGQRVAAGDRLGEVGLSGNTAFPHLDFVVRRDGQALDPYSGAAPGLPCGTAGSPLWSEAALRALPYRDSGAFGAGFATAVPDAAALRRGQGVVTSLPAGAARLVFWADLFGARRGDRVEIRIHGPGGAELAASASELPRDFPGVFAAGEARRPPGGWPAGQYRAVVTLRRDGTAVAEAARTLARAN